MRKKLIQVMPNLKTDGGFFRFLTLLDGSEAVPLGMAYGLMHSGDKPIAPFLAKLLGDNETVTEADERTIAGILDKIYGDKWEHIFSALTTEYDPLENYSMVEHGTDVTDEDTTHKKGAEQITVDTGATHGTTESQSHGANTDGFKPVGKDVVDNDARRDTTHNAERNDADTKDSTLTHNLTRSGNIGVTTSQQMLQSEIDVRQYIYFEEIFKDIDKYLCLSVYE